MKNEAVIKKRNIISSVEEPPENMLAEGDVFVKDEKRNLYYDASTIENVEDTVSNEASEINPEEKVLEPQLDVQLTFDDQTILSLSAFPFEDIEEGSIYLEDEVVFVKYLSVATGREVSTKQAELAIKAAADAKAAAEAQAAAEARAAAAKQKPKKKKTQQSNSSGDGCVNDGLVY